MRFYLYVSDAKIEMLFGQIPEAERRRIAGTLKLDLKILGVDLSVEPREETRYSKLRLVEEHIRSREEVGTVDRPKGFFAGQMDLRWGVWGEDSGGPGHSMVYFTGRTKRTTLGLGGSERHLIGDPPGPPMLDRPSGKSNLLRILDALTTDPDFAAERSERMGAQETWVVSAIMNSVNKLPGPAQRLEFLARTLFRADGEHSVLLGTPVYVAVAE
jgi:uncharacterized protein DUF7019